MKKILLFLANLFHLVPYDTKKENSKTKLSGSKIDTSNQITVSGEIKGHSYVDLGLPSGKLWATCNIGASKPTEYGEYYAWGELKSKKEYLWSNYKFLKDSRRDIEDIYPTSEDFSKYTIQCEIEKEYYQETFVGDRKTVLEAIDDTATANWGKKWRMPTFEEQQELVEGCDWKRTDNFNGSGIAGYIGTSKANGNVIFMPAAGDREGMDNCSIGLNGYYWSSSLSENFFSNSAYYIDFRSEYTIFFCNRNFGMSVRAVVK